MDAFIGEIRAFGFNFNPQDWLPCNGQLLPIQQYTALFSLLGTNFGGNGTTNFALPNLQGNVVVGTGTAATSTVYNVGETGGETAVTLISTEIPYHTHTVSGATAAPSTYVQAPAPTNYLSNVASSKGGVLGPGRAYVPVTTSPVTAMGPLAIAPTGSSVAHSNMMPYQAINYCICTNGEWPQRP